jgi:hypothetical protein
MQLQVLIVDVKRWTWYLCIGDFVLGVDWQPKHITLGHFEAIDISGQNLAKNLIELLDLMSRGRKLLLMSRMRDLTLTL